MSLFNHTEQIKEQLDRFLPESDEAVKAFLGVVTMIAADDNETAILVDEITNHAISKTPAYRDFVNKEFLGAPKVKFSREVKTEIIQGIQ